MRILFVGLNYAPEPVGIGPYSAGLASGLAARGHEVTVVAGKPYYPQWRAYPGQPGGTTVTTEEGVTVVRVPHYIPANPTGVRRIAHHLSFAASALSPSLEAAGGPIDLVFTVAPSLLSVPVAALAAWRARTPLWLHVQDFEVEAAFATGLLDQSGRLARMARKVDDRIVGLADTVSTISPQMCARLQAKGIPSERIYELRNWSNGAFDFANADPAAYRREWGLEGRKIALYSGNIANKQGLETVIDAARALRERDDIAFVICGEGPNRVRLREQAAGLANIQFHDLQPAERMADLLTAADVHLLPQIPGAADLVLPSKLTNMLASGKPVIATAGPGTGLYTEVDGCGINTSPGDPQALASVIAALVDDPERAAVLGKAAADRARERWSQEAIIDAAERRMSAIVSTHRELSNRR